VGGPGGAPNSEAGNATNISGDGGGASTTQLDPAAGASDDAATDGAASPEGSSGATDASVPEVSADAPAPDLNADVANAADADALDAVAVDAGAADAPAVCIDGQKPLDLLLMVSQSDASMSASVDGGSLWDVVTSGLLTFVRQDGMSGVNVGIGYFGSSCVPSDYAQPDLEIAPVSGGGATNVAASLAAHGPATDAPTSAALEGALMHASSWATRHPDHTTAVVLVMAEVPSTCTTLPDDIAAIASSYAADHPSIVAYVVAIAEPHGSQGAAVLSAADTIASGAGVGAFHVSMAGDVPTEVVTALNNVRRAAEVRCGP
jgi:hypothetical protein